MSTVNNILQKLSCEEFDAFDSKIDSDYFGIRSAKTILKKACVLEKKQNELLSFLRDFEFSSITNKSNDPFNNRWLGEKTTAFLTDINIQLVKTVVLTEKSDVRMAEISDNFPGNDQVVRIAENSFKVSQFLNDPYLPSEKAKCIYGDITRNAFGKPGRYFAVIKSEDVVMGYLLFSVNHSTRMTTIELLAIDQNHTGNGIGKSLIRSTEYYVSKLGMETIKVGTQVTNMGALNFYTSYGFKYVECSSIYHYWPSKT